MERLKWYIVGIIFLLAISIRLINFKESIYFGFDEARDAYLSTEIYTQGHLKIMGPPATGNIGVFHGSLYWYILGPIYLLSQNDPTLVSFIFRIINALGVLGVFFIGNYLFTPIIGLLASFLYALSYEQSQYAMYVGNPGWGVITTLIIFTGASILIKNQKFKYFSLYLMFGGAALATQLNIMYFYTFLLVITILILFRKYLVGINYKHYLGSFFLSGAILSTFLLSELKYNFRTVKTVINLVSKGFGIMGPSQSKYQLYWDKYIAMFNDNITPLLNINLISIIAIIVTLFTLIKSFRNNSYRLVILWMLAWIFLMLFGGHTSYYTNAGLGVGVIIAFSLFLIHFFKKQPLLIGVIVLAIGIGNIKRISEQSYYSLIPEIKPQPLMKLADEIRVIDKMYQQTKGAGFTVRVTGIPYKVQTVWAYLFNNYGQKTYGYQPYYETGNTLGFPGILPVPKSGTTCFRFLIREPMRGLPVYLVELDEKEENNFSKTIVREEIGNFILETRLALDPNCHNHKP